MEGSRHSPQKCFTVHLFLRHVPPCPHKYSMTQIHCSLTWSNWQCYCVCTKYCLQTSALKILFKKPTLLRMDLFWLAIFYQNFTNVIVPLTSKDINFNNCQSSTHTCFLIEPFRLRNSLVGCKLGCLNGM